MLSVPPPPAPVDGSSEAAPDEKDLLDWLPDVDSLPSGEPRQLELGRRLLELAKDPATTLAALARLGDEHRLCITFDFPGGRECRVSARAPGFSAIATVKDREVHDVRVA